MILENNTQTHQIRTNHSRFYIQFNKGRRRSILKCDQGLRRSRAINRNWAKNLLERIEHHPLVSGNRMTGPNHIRKQEAISSIPQAVIDASNISQLVTRSVRHKTHPPLLEIMSWDGINPIQINSSPYLSCPITIPKKLKHCFIHHTR